MNIHIRKATLDDMPALLEFEQGLVDAERPMDDMIIAKEVTHYYDIPALIHGPDVTLLVAETDGKNIGCGYGRIMENNRWNIEKLYGYIGFMYVLPEFRGKGISDRIINRLCEWFREKGLREVRLKVYETNEPAIKAYRKSGFFEHMKEMRMKI
jgi:GNAT superfamily N-acetyltransferase